MVILSKRHMNMLKTFLDGPKYWSSIPKTADDLIEAKLISTYKASNSRFVMPGNYRITPLGRALLNAEDQSKEDKEV